MSSQAITSSLPSIKDRLVNGWFMEINDQWPGQAMSLQVDKVLFEQKSEYQEVFVFQSKTWGNVLVLDGVIQLTDKDECAYQEMIAHLPLYSHHNPEHVLIIGGGDGGVIRECVKHAGVKSITICEIDQVVIDAGKKYFPSVASAWNDPRVTLHCGDGAVFMKKEENLSKYDVIITDSSDPVGPAQSLFETPFYQAMYAALKPGGKVATQAESMWVHLNLIQKLIKDATAIYAGVEYATTQIPTYPAGQIGILVCSKTGGKSKTSCVKPARRIPRGENDKYKYYSSALHEAAFVLPAFVAAAVGTAVNEAGKEKKEKAAEGKKSAKKRKQEEKEKDEDEEGEEAKEGEKTEEAAA